MDHQQLSEKFGSNHVIDTNNGFDTSTLRGKTVVITGGGSGIGEASLRGFVKNGAFVVFLELLQERGEAIQRELGSSSVAFVQGNVTNWSDQKKLFQTALEKSSSGLIDVVFANAAMATPWGDDLMNDALDDSGDLAEPNLDVVTVGLNGMMYTAKLALYHFRQQSTKGNDRDQCLIMTSSIAGYWDHMRHPQYAATKWAIRGMMRCLRKTYPDDGLRINIIAPWYIRTRLISSESWDLAKKQGNMAFAEVEDAATAVLHLASVNSIHGRALTIVPRQAAASGYVDFNRDAYDLENIAQAEWLDDK